jgi:hypothetical protein
MASHFFTVWINRSIEAETLAFTPITPPLDPGPAAVSPLHAVGLNSVDLVMAVEEEFDLTLTDPIHALGMD